MPVLSPIGFNQLRPAMSVDPQTSSIQTFANPYGSNKTLFISDTQSTINKAGVQVSNTSGLATAGGLGIGTGNFTVELWFYMTAAPTTSYTFMYEQSYGGQSMSVYNDYKINLSQSFVGDLWRSTNTVSLNTWTYIAWTRSGNTSNLYINGVLDSTRTVSNNFVQASDKIYTYIGGGINGGTQINWTGYLSEIRFSNVARYSANFTPPTVPFKDDINTLLLVHGGSNGLTSISDDNT